MRYGRSLYLGLVDAEDIRHGDTRERLITCPACAEAVVKVERKLPGGGVSHYLRHYREFPAERGRRCELRVASLTAAQVEAARAEARGQALALFVARFNGCVDRALLGWLDKAPPALRERLPPFAPPLAGMAARPRWRRLARDIRDHMRAAPAEERERTWRSLWRDHEPISPLPWREAADAHARGMLAHALAPGSERQFLHLFGVATAVAHFGVEHHNLFPPRPDRAPTPERDRAAVAAALRTLVYGSDLAVKQALRKWRNDPAPVPASGWPNFLEKVLFILMRQVCVVLYHVPYGEIARDLAAAVREAVPVDISGESARRRVRRPGPVRS